jgi:hypothetical protein
MTIRVANLEARLAAAENSGLDQVLKGRDFSRAARTAKSTLASAAQVKCGERDKSGTRTLFSLTSQV